MNDSEETEDTIREDLDSNANRELPCERPNFDVWDQGVAVFGAENNSAGKSRSSSTSINRVEFINLSSTLPSLPSREELSDSMALWDEGAYTAYKLNCHKKKRKVENLIQFKDKILNGKCEESHTCSAESKKLHLKVQKFTCDSPKIQ